jgi:hypothetical protein
MKQGALISALAFPGSNLGAEKLRALPRLIHQVHSPEVLPTNIQSNVRELRLEVAERLAVITKMLS